MPIGARVNGAEPLLEAVFDTNGLPAVVLCGKPERDYAIGAETALPPDGAWGAFQQGPLEDLFRQIPVPVPTERPLFLRAWRPE